MRDESHIQAEVLMNDETGRRNYAKYNQYLTLMKVSADQAADAKTMRCGEMQSGSSYDAQIHVPQQVDDEPSIDAHTTDATAAALDLRVSGKSGAMDVAKKSRQSVAQDEDQSQQSKAASKASLELSNAKKERNQNVIYHAARQQRLQ